MDNVVKVLSVFKNATFLGKLFLDLQNQTFLFADLGSNIGMYTVVVAAMRRQVVAVDADPKNLAYIRTSLDLTNTTQYVRLVQNAVRLG